MLSWLLNLFARRSVSVTEVAITELPTKQLEKEIASPALVLKTNGDVYLDLDDWIGAETYYRQAIAADTNYAAAYNNLGLSLMQQRRFGEAEQHIKRAISLDPALFNAFYMLGKIATQLDQWPEAIAYFRQAIQIHPNFPEAYSAIGGIYDHLGDPGKAAEAYRQAIAINPDGAEPYCNLAGIESGQGRRQLAIEYYRRALVLAPSLNTARVGLLHEMLQVCDWDNLEEHIAVARQHVREAPVDLDSRDSPFSFITLPGTTPQEHRLCAERWTQGTCHEALQLRQEQAFTFKRAPHAKIRVGYLSADFHIHATAILMAEVFELHNKERFHFAAYSYGPDDQSIMRTRLKNAFDEFHDIEKESFLESARRIYHDGIDILVDLKGYTGGSRSAILALRPAPVQVNFLGYPGTMGADFVDYIIADHFIIPAQYQHHYTEKIARLPACYQPNDRTRSRPQEPARASLQLPDGKVVFCCFNQTYKITPNVFAVWCKLLKAVEHSVLWLLSNTSETEQNLRKEAARCGIDEARLIFAPRVILEQHLARLQCADIFLDTLPYNAHTTCSEALWMGLPVVTCAGESFASRVAGSLLSALDMPELITYNLSDYYDLALELATNKEKRLSVKDKIKSNIFSTPLFDSTKFTRDLEDIYETMWKYTTIDSSDEKNP